MADREYIYNSVGKGWKNILERLLDNLELIEFNFPIEVGVTQVKEKFGGLRFYYYTSYTGNKSYPDVSGWGKVIEDLVEFTENKSYTVCEFCGERGTLRDDLSWVLTLCSNCHIEVINRRNA